MTARIALLAFPLIAWTQVVAQTPPPEVDQALRARATQFFQYYVDGDFRKAYDMVAEDTKDQYFNAAKNRIKTFQLADIKYSDNFTKAAITVKATRDIYVMGQSVPTDISEVMTFKIEDGKWVWYWVNEGLIVTPMSAVKADTSGPVSPLPTGLPTDFSKEGMQAAAMKLLSQNGIDKSEIVLATNKTSESKVVFHNGMGGPVQVQLAPFEEIPGFSAKLDKMKLEASENAELMVQYQPGAGDQKPPDVPLELRLVVSPISQAYTVTVKFTR